MRWSQCTLARSILSSSRLQTALVKHDPQKQEGVKKKTSRNSSPLSLGQVRAKRKSEESRFGLHRNRLCALANRFGSTFLTE